MPQGMFGVPNVRAQVIERAFAPEKPKPKKGGIFAPGGPARGIAGTIGDFLLQYSGFNPIYAPVQQQRQQRAAALRQASLERETDWQDWVRKQEWERANPKAANPTSLQQNYDWLVSQGRTEEAESLLQRSTDDAVWKQDWQGNWMRVSPSGGSDRPEIGSVMADPRQRGGGVSNGTGGF